LLSFYFRFSGIAEGYNAPKTGSRHICLASAVPGSSDPFDRPINSVGRRGAWVIWKLWTGISLPLCRF